MMNSTDSDVLVVGAGFSGLVAALCAAQRGKSVRLLSQGAGTLPISSHCIDLLGYTANNTLIADDPWDALETLPQEHPYRIIGKKNIRLAFSFLKQLSEQHRWPFIPLHPEGKLRNCLLPTIMGTLRPSYFAPSAFALQQLEQAKQVLIAGIQGLYECQPALIATQLRRYSQYSPKEFSEVLLQPPFVSKGASSLSTLDMAHFIDTEKGLRWLIETLQVHVSQDSYQAILLPPICGTKASMDLMERLTGELSCAVVEMLSPPPGVGGLRLRNLLLEAIKPLGIRHVENATVSGAVGEHNTCKALVVSGKDGERYYKARNFIIATGGLLGGGIFTEPGKARESIFHLPLAIPEETEQWSDPAVFGSHLFARMGVMVNNRLNPVNAQGQTLLTNVHFIGRSLGGYDPVTEKSGNGVALASAWYAAQLL